MKLKLAFLVVGFLLSASVMAQKTNLPNVPPGAGGGGGGGTPTTPAEYWAMGYKNAYNLALQGNYTTYQLSITAADEAGEMDYADGLQSGYIAGLAKKQVIIHPPSIQDYVVTPSSGMFNATFIFTDGSHITISGILYY